jgi:hypothetical protein
MDIQRDDRHPPYILTVAALGADGPSMAPWPRSFLPTQTSNLPFERDLAEFFVQRIAARCAHVDERGAVDTRPGSAAAILRRHGGQTRPAPRRGRTGRSAKAPRDRVIGVEFFVNGGGSRAGSSFARCQEQVTVALLANGSNR